MQIKKYLCAALMAVSTCLLTSCWDPDEDQTSATGYFTITGNTTTGYVLYMDNGGKLIPDAISVSNMTNGKGFGEIERVLMLFTYKEKNLSADKNTITGGELVSGQPLVVYKPLTEKEAEEKKVTAADSLFDIVSMRAAWAYRGYLNVIINGMYGYNEKKDAWLYPNINFVVDDTKMKPNELNIKLCYNKRTKKGSVDAGGKDFTSCLDIRGLENYTTGRDTITINLTADGLDKPTKIKVAREDFVKGNWR